MQRRAFFAKVDFYDLLGVVPCAAGIRHKQRLVQPEDRNRNQIARKQIRIKARKRNRERENHDKDVEHAFLRIQRADTHHFLRIFLGGRLFARKLDVLLDEIVELDETELTTKDEELIVDELLDEEELIVDELLDEEELEVFSEAQEARIVHKNKAESKLIFFIFLLFVI